MPELPEVERARRLLADALAGRTIVRAVVADDPIVFGGIRKGRIVSALQGRTLKDVRRRGKYLWLELDRRPRVMIHFGMTGSFEVYGKGRRRPRFWKLVLTGDNGLSVAVLNKRRLGRVRLLDDPEHEEPISRLGFDPLLDMPSASVVGERLAGRKAPIKAVLLDQRFAAGVGNWIADEVLYQARIDPHRRACDLTGDEAKRLRNRLAAIVRKAVAVDADKERFPRTWLFHHRWGKNADAKTARGEKIVHETIGGRTTAYVPAVQR